MSSIVFDFEGWLNQDVLKDAVRYALNEEDSRFLFAGRDKMKIEWFRITPNMIAIEETNMDMNDIESAQLRLCNILINMIPEADFTSRALYWARITGYEKAFHLNYRNGQLSG